MSGPANVLVNCKAASHRILNVRNTGPMQSTHTKVLNADLAPLTEINACHRNQQCRDGIQDLPSERPNVLCF